MYTDPKRIRDNRVTVRFDDYEFNIIQSLAIYYGEQPSTILRQIVIEEACKELRKPAQRTSGRGRALYPVAKTSPEKSSV